MKQTRLSPLLSEDSSGAFCDTFQALILPKDFSVGLGGQALPYLLCQPRSRLHSSSSAS